MFKGLFKKKPDYKKMYEYELERRKAWEEKYTLLVKRMNSALDECGMSRK